jgi:hypothetical protein
MILFLTALSGWSMAAGAGAYLGGIVTSTLNERWDARDFARAQAEVLKYMSRAPNDMEADALCPWVELVIPKNAECAEKYDARFEKQQRVVLSHTEYGVLFQAVRANRQDVAFNVLFDAQLPGVQERRVRELNLEEARRERKAAVA